MRLADTWTWLSFRLAARPQSVASIRRVAPITAFALAIATVGSTGRIGHAAPASQASLIAYHMVSQWPQREQAAEGLFQQPSDMDVARDGRVYVADAGIGGVHTLLPSGQFVAPFGVAGGFPEQLGRVGAIAIGPDPMGADADGERLYVLDTAIDRIVIYGLDGSYQGQWENIVGEGVAASTDSRVYVLDRESSQVRALDAATGQERFAFGERGTDNGQFTNFMGIGVSPDGRVLAVADKHGMRVQLFDLATDEALAGATPPAPATFRRAYDLLDAKYTQGTMSCRAERINALGSDAVFVGQGDSACIVDARAVTFAIASSANKGTICRSTVMLPRLHADTQQYYAVATYDPNSGKCGDKRQDLATTPVVVQYSDQELRTVQTVWQAASNDESANPILFSPESISMPSPDEIFVQDMSSRLRFFSLDGQQLATAARDTGGGQLRGPMMTGDFDFFEIERAVGSDVLGEVFGTYVHGQRSGTTMKFETGLGRFRTVERRTQTGTIEVIDPIWTDVISSGGATAGPRPTIVRIEMPSVAYDPVSRELLVLRSDSVAQQRSVDVRIMRYTVDGKKAGEAWDLPDDGKVNPYSDMTVGADGRLLVLDGLDDLVRVYEADGTPAFVVDVAFDARAVAGGPADTDGSVFVLREPGIVERLTEDGRVTARFDARPLPSSDPTTLTDLVVDGSGRVYISDAQTSLISVFEASSDPEVLPVPGDRQCAFVGRSDVQPGSLQLGRSTTLSLTLDGRCGVGEDPSDIVVVVPYYGQLQAGVDPSASTITDMLNLVSRLNFDKHRAGIVSYYNTTKVELPLTHDREAYAAAARRIQRFDPPSDSVKARLKDAMEAAEAQLPAEAGRRRVMVLMQPDYCDPDFEPFPGACAGYPPAGETAAAIREAGIQIVVVGSFGAFDLASSDEDIARDVESAHRRMVRYEIPTSLAKEVDVRGVVPDNMAVDPATISGGGQWTSPELTWQSADMAGRLTLTVGLTPTEGGRWPALGEAGADLTDGWGASQHVTFPIPEVEVVAPTPTAVPPTATPTPAPPTATPSRTRHYAYLPLALSEVCTPTKRGIDVALVIDASTTMAEATGDGRTKIAAAQAAARWFVGRLDPSRDQAAVVTFNSVPVLGQGLVADHVALERAIGAISLAKQTRLDLAVATARQELLGPRHRAANQPAMIVFSDGLANPVPVAVALEEARQAKADGAVLFTMAWGDDVDASALATMASQPGYSYLSPSEAEFAAAYAAVAVDIPCPADEFWGQR